MMSHTETTQASRRLISAKANEKEIEKCYKDIFQTLRFTARRRLSLGAVVHSSNTSAARQRDELSFPVQEAKWKRLHSAATSKNLGQLGHGAVTRKASGLGGTISSPFSAGVSRPGHRFKRSAAPFGWRWFHFKTSHRHATPSGRGSRTMLMLSVFWRKF